MTNIIVYISDVKNKKTISIYLFIYYFFNLNLGDKMFSLKCEERGKAWSIFEKRERNVNK